MRYVPLSTRPARPAALFLQGLLLAQLLSGAQAQAGSALQRKGIVDERAARACPLSLRSDRSVPRVVLRQDDRARPGGRGRRGRLRVRAGRRAGERTRFRETGLAVPGPK